jgi:diadenosine tetraphosphate (Ap4A) HIT family hydrolase
VHENQSYLGRLILRLRRTELGSLSCCSADEWLSLYENICAYERIVNELFSPSRLNYSQMGNEYPQLHVHAVPRYSSSRTWRGRVFEDIRWGRNWAPTPASPLTADEIYDFASWFRDETRRRIEKR